MVELACPECYTSLRYGKWPGDCCACYKLELEKEIPDLIPVSLWRDSAYQFEIARYDAIAGAGPENYAGYADSMPVYRAQVMRPLLEEAGVTEFVNIGPGFGALESATGGYRRTAIDPCLPFLEYVRERYPDVQCVRGVAERLPLATGSVPCLVADSVFQSIVNREKFLYEIGRVCAPNARLFLTIACAWNYPRRPQNGFNVNREDERDVLERFLQELGFMVGFHYLNLEKQDWNERGDYLYILGKK